MTFDIAQIKTFASVVKPGSLGRAAAALDVTQPALEDIDALRGLSEGAARVGAVASAASSILPRAIDRLLAKWPRLRFEIVEGVSDRLAAARSTREGGLALGDDAPDSDEIAAVRDCRGRDTTHIVAAAAKLLGELRALTARASD